MFSAQLSEGDSQGNSDGPGGKLAAGLAVSLVTAGIRIICVLSLRVIFF